MEITIRIPHGPEGVGVVGSADRNIKMLREALGVRISSVDGSIRIGGESDAVAVARNVIEQIGAAAGREEPLSREQVLDLIADESSRARLGGRSHTPGASSGTLTWDGDMDVYAAGRRVVARTPNQERYLEAIRTNDLVFGVGPAGTGKTFLAVAAAVHLLKQHRAKKVVLVRPAVEAGEKLGFLPGDLEAKVNPYLRPLLDALHDMADYGTIRRFMEGDVVEIVPLAFMRGRTLNGSVIILDEAQNSTRGQMKMFLTRMGHGSKMIVTGDPTQVDLPDPGESGLVDAVRRLKRVQGVESVWLDGGDVVRHRLVQRVLEAYGDERPIETEAG